MCKTEELLDLTHTIAASLFSGLEYPWEALSGIGGFILALGPKLDKNEFELFSDGVWVARDAAVFPSAYIYGPCIVDHGAEIRHCAFLRGNAVIGKGCVVGNSVEIKNSVLFDGVQVPHYNYVGDSVLGYKSHMGAGAITSNLKSDKSQVVVKSAAGEIETGRRKFGAILGDYAEIGCNSVLNPGTVIGRGTNVYPVSSVRGVIPENSIYKSAGNIVGKILP